MRTVFLYQGGRRIVHRRQSMSRAFFGHFGVGVGVVGYRASCCPAREKSISAGGTRFFMSREGSVCGTDSGSRRRSVSWVHL
jgi:hypothetical protein